VKRSCTRRNDWIASIARRSPEFRTILPIMSFLLMDA
jgi:hypothetical protein